MISAVRGKAYKPEPLAESRLTFTHICAVGLIIERDMTATEWLEECRALANVSGYNLVGGWRFWAIGDMLRVGKLAGDFHHGTMYTEAQAIFGTSEKVLRNAVYVAKKIAPDVRREDVPFFHHQSVAPFARSEQIALLAVIADGNGLHVPLNLKETRALCAWYVAHKKLQRGPVNPAKLLRQWKDSRALGVPFAFTFRPPEIGEAPEDWLIACQQAVTASQQAYLAASPKLTSTRRRRRDLTWGVGRLQHPIAT